MQTVADIIDALGGSASISRGTGIPLTTIEGWKEVNYVPEWRQPPLMGFAKALKSPLSKSDFPPVSARKPRAGRDAA